MNPPRCTASGRLSHNSPSLHLHQGHHSYTHAVLDLQEGTTRTTPWCTASGRRSLASRQSSSAHCSNLRPLVQGRRYWALSECLELLGVGCELDELHSRALLKYATSSSRAPLLGFK